MLEPVAPTRVVLLVTTEIRHAASQGLVPDAEGAAERHCPKGIADVMPGCAVQGGGYVTGLDDSARVTCLPNLQPAVVETDSPATGRQVVRDDRVIGIQAEPDNPFNCSISEIGLQHTRLGDDQRIVRIEHQR